MSGDDTPSAEPHHWQHVHDRLAARPVEQLSPAQNDELAAALFWLNEPRATIEARHRAFQGWHREGQPEQALRSAWYLFYEHWLVGEAVVARGWFERSRRLVETGDVDPEGLAAGWLAIAEVDVAHADGHTEHACERAVWARRIGERHGDRDLVAMALQAEGRMRIALGASEAGLARLDDAMVSVIGNELDPLYTGWVYCNVIGTCHGVGDLRRANEWSAAAQRWCESIRDGLLYPGLCRVYRAELAQLRGDWPTAEAQARQACEDLEAYDPRYAASAHYVVGELCRLQGRIDEADAAFARARELGHPTQPGHALLRAASGEPADALALLRTAANAVGPATEAATVEALQLFTALIDVAEILGDTATIISTADEIARRVGAAPSELASAFAASAAGRAAGARRDPRSAATDLGRAGELFSALDMPFEAARQRQLLAHLLQAHDDHAGARVHWAAAVTTFDRLGVPTGGGLDQAPTAGAPAHPGPAIAPLSDREREVLALVAGGLTNKAIADALHLSPHTVARHIANILSKLGVSSRAAAASIAVAAGLSPADGQD
ncbi:MAG: LuxR C-terminal-related transcriptional regulator [Actinomycetota bacterium]